MEDQFAEVGKRIQLRRKELHIKQFDLAEIVDISNNHMSSIECGKEKASLDTFIGLCEALRVTPDYLLLGSMHANDVPQNTVDKLRLCSMEDIELACEFIELLVKRNSANWTENNLF